MSELIESKLAWRGQVEWHDFEGLRLLIQSLSHLVVWFFHQWTKRWPTPFLVVAGGPKSGNWRFLPGHLMLESWCINLSNKSLLKYEWKFSVDHTNVGEAESQVNTFIILNKINDGSEKCFKCIYGHVLAHGCSLGYWYWIRVDGSETFLIDWVLANGWRDLFFTIESHKVVLDLWVNYENWLQVMNICPLGSFSENIHFRTNCTVRNLWQFCLNVIRKTSEVLHIYTSTCL